MLNYILILGHFGTPAMGLGSAAIASISAFGFGPLVCFLFGQRFTRQQGFLRGLTPRANVVQLVKLSLPSSMQQQLPSAGFPATFFIIG